MRSLLIAILVHVLASLATAGPRQSVVTVFEHTFVDDFPPPMDPPQVARGVVPTGKFRYVVLLGQLTDANPELEGVGVSCVFTMTETTDLTTTVSVRGFTGTITREDGFVYSGNGEPRPVLGPFLFCRTRFTDPQLIASKVTLKAVFTK